MAKLRSRRIERGDVERESCDGCGADFWDRASVVDALGGVDELDEML